MIKSIIRITLSYFLIFGQTIAYAQSTAAILPQGKTQFFDNNGDPLTSGKVYFYVPSTTNTKTTWQDSSKAVTNANPVILDGGGRAVIYGDGTYRQILKDRNGNTIYDAITASAGTGGSIATGDGDLVGTIKPWAGLVAPNQYAFAYGQELSRTTYSVLYTAITLQQIINCTSGNATASGFSDTSQIPTGAVIESLCFAPGSTVVSKTSTTVTFNHNSSLSTTDTVRIFLYGNGNGSTTFNLPDLRAVYIFGRSNMGGTDFPLITTQYLGVNPAATGARGGSQNTILGTINLPPYTPVGTISQITPAGSVKNAASGTTTYTPTGTPTAAGTVTKPTITSSIVFSSSGTNNYTPTGINAPSALSITNGTSIVQATGTTLNLTASGALGQAVSLSGTAAAQTFTGNAVTGTISSALDATPTFSNSGSTFAGNSTTFSFTGTDVTPTFTGDAQGGLSNAFANLPPSTSLNYIIKITPDSNSTDASGVTSLGGMTGDIACGTGLLCTGNIVSISGSPLIINSSPIIGGTSGGFLVNVSNVLSNTDILGCCNLTTSGTININPLADSGRKGLNISNSHTTGILAGAFYDNLISVTNSAIVRGDGSSGHEPVWAGTQISASVNTGFDTQNNSGTQVRGQAFGLSVGMVTNGNTATLADLGAASFGTFTNHSNTSTFYPVTGSGVIGHLGSTTGAVMGAEFNASIECIIGPICGTAVDRYAINLINYHTGTASRLNTAISVMGGNSDGQFKHALTLNPYSSAAQVLQTDGDLIYIPTAQTLSSIINVENTSTITHILNIQAAATLNTIINAPLATISGYIYNTANALLTGSGIGTFGSATSTGGLAIKGAGGDNLQFTYQHGASPTFTLGAVAATAYFTSVGFGTNAWQVDNATNRLSALSGLTVAPTLIFNGSTSGTLTVKAAAISGSNTLTFPAGTTDFSATGGTSQVVKQTSSGGAFTVARLACSDLSDAAATCSSASSATTATNATNTAITDDTSTNASMNLTWVTSNTGNLPQKTTSTKLTFNPSTGALSSTSFTGAGTGLTGTAASLTSGTVTTNANLTGVITSTGNTTSIASQTGSGTKFVVDNTPTLITPVLGIATATSIAINGATIGSNGLAVTGTAAISSTLTSTAHTITSASSTALTVGLTGATNPAFTVDSSTGSQAAGFKITGAATGGTVALVATDSGLNTNVTLNAKGSGTIGIGSVSTGAVTITPALTLSAALTYGGVTLSNAVTGTGNMVLGTSPTLATPTLGVASATSINKVAITAPASSATLTIADGTTLTQTTTTSIGRGQYLATNTNDNATAGNIGELIESSIASGSAVSLTNATAANITSISLTAGDWDVWGTVSYSAGGTTIVNYTSAWIHTTSAALPTVPNGGAFVQWGGAITGSAPSTSAGRMRISVNATTTVYLETQATFNTSTLAAYGYIGARRVR